MKLRAKIINAGFAPAETMKAPANIDVLDNDGNVIGGFPITLDVGGFMSAGYYIGGIAVSIGDIVEVSVSAATPTNP